MTWGETNDILQQIADADTYKEGAYQAAMDHCRTSLFLQTTNGKCGLKGHVQHSFLVGGGLCGEESEAEPHKFFLELSQYSYNF